jgi:hypothetical protein
MSGLGDSQFILVTSGMVHSLKMGPFAELIKRLRQHGQDIKKAEIYFVIPNQLESLTFKLTDVT